MTTDMLAKLVCPTCAAPGLSLPSGPATSGLESRPFSSIACPACNTGYVCTEGILDLAVTSRAPKMFSSQWAMEFRPLITLYERIWRPLVTWPFSDLSWEMDMAARWLDLSPGLDVLDLACGPANFTRRFEHAVRPGTVVGIDLSWPMLKQARREIGKDTATGIVLMRVDVTRWPFIPESFERIHCAGALHLFPALEQVFHSIFAALKPGGVFVGATYCRGGSVMKRHFQDYISGVHGFHWFDPDELQGLAADAGFSGWEHAMRKQGIVFRVRKMGRASQAL